MTELTHYEIIDDIAIVTMDDGKANAFGPNMIAAVNASLDRAADDARAVLLTGRPGLFSGGFDLKVIRSGDVEAAKTMRLAGSKADDASVRFAIATGHCRPWACDRAWCVLPVDG